MDEAALHVVFGAGQVGSQLAARLLASGHRVRVIRHSSGAVPAGVEVRRGDAADRSFCLEAAAGARVVYHCINPPYSTREWTRLVPRYMSNLIDAAGSSGSRLVVLDNLYMLGRPGGRAIDEATPMAPCSRKGEIRAQTAEMLITAHRRGQVYATSGRASDFYGPGGQLTAFGEQLWKPALKGSAGRMIVPLDAVHTYHYIPDVAAGLQALGEADPDVEGRWWMLPCRPAGTARQLIDEFAAALGRPIRVSEMPIWMVRAVSLFMPVLRELPEMRYQWEEPFVCDDRHFRERFHIAATPGPEAARATVDWARATYGPPARS